MSFPIFIFQEMKNWQKTKQSLGSFDLFPFDTEKKNVECDRWRSELKVEFRRELQETHAD